MKPWIRNGAILSIFIYLFVLFVYGEGDPRWLVFFALALGFGLSFIGTFVSKAIGSNTKKKTSKK